jgi:hypothetical protein
MPKRLRQRSKRPQKMRMRELPRRTKELQMRMKQQKRPTAPVERKLGVSHLNAVN